MSYVIQSSSGVGGGRIVVDVGGTKFFTAVETLTSNSTYFASLLGGNWNESAALGEEDVFLDQDPIAFGKLLEYMRRGLIKVEDVDIGVLILAEFLGLNRLILAVKVRWYCNIGKGPVSAESDEAIAVAFDEVHGGISKAISNGLFHFFLRQDDVDADKDLAVVSVSCEHDYQVFVDKIVNDTPIPRIRCGRGGIIGACNGLQADRFLLSPYHKLDAAPLVYTGSVLMLFSRRRHSVLRTGNATGIFIPTQDEVEKGRTNSPKQFAVYITQKTENDEDSIASIIAPAEFIDGVDEAVNMVDHVSNPYAEASIQDQEDMVFMYWLLIRNFTTPETWVLESEGGYDMFRRWFIKFHSQGFSEECVIQVFSRPLSSAHQEE